MFNFPQFKRAVFTTWKVELRSRLAISTWLFSSNALDIMDWSSSPKVKVPLFFCSRVALRWLCPQKKKKQKPKMNGIQGEAKK